MQIDNTNIFNLKSFLKKQLNYYFMGNFPISYNNLYIIRDIKNIHRDIITSILKNKIVIKEYKK